MSVKDNYKNVQASVKKACERSNRDSDNVHIIAVTKYVSVDTAKEAVEAGIEHIGENRLDEALSKWEEIGSGVTWHFIGNLQTKKVKKMIHAFDYIHSLDRLSLAKEIDKRTNPGEYKKCFVQVNVTGEESKSGLSPEEVLSFIEELKNYPSIEVAGLMTMAPYTDDHTLLRSAFRKLRELKEGIEEKKLSHAPCHELSMGMSNDFEIAVEEGATFVRIGSSLVGKEK
ncbi:YggS family pyridoxal phosphate-dependent enzyme [Salipaludibacillus aurantiacus]|uniref:Pyridoxal phosphate homeostasis protein n=1 Tax=Salipaludibacillus aurantiacus TaxID=1601833 RepID=A0A1H9QSI4_9BACI|nr:YggS family pyridoxal phosphate-dependent enzyme [Salipaludibacillus aurantiacus]SER63422.1 hypothetical protein SAMN05518684_102353 [Salipaludibacillus aurantiacus]